MQSCLNTGITLACSHISGKYEVCRERLNSLARTAVCFNIRGLIQSGPEASETCKGFRASMISFSHKTRL